MAFGYPGTPNLGDYFYQQGKQRGEMNNQRSLSREKEYSALLNTPATDYTQQAFNAAVNVPISPEVGSQTNQIDPGSSNFLNNIQQDQSSNFSYPSTQIDSSINQSDLLFNESASKAAIEPINQSSMQSKESLGITGDINSVFLSNDPVEFSKGIGEFHKYEDQNIDPNTPAGQFKQQAQQKWLISTDEKGNNVYECPLTKKPCSKKTFWSRLKEFFLNLIGVQDHKKTLGNINKLDKQDPVTRSFTSSQPQVKAKTEIESPWENSAYKAAQGGM